MNLTFVPVEALLNRSRVADLIDQMRTSCPYIINTSLRNYLIR